MNKGYRSDLGWVCYCGMENDKKEYKCQFCKREVQVDKLCPIFLNDYKETFCLYEHMEYISSLRNAKEIYDYLEKLNYLDTYFNAIVLPEVKKYLNTERMYGSMKNSVLNKLKELYANK